MLLPPAGAVVAAGAVAVTVVVVVVPVDLADRVVLAARFVVVEGDGETPFASWSGTLTSMTPTTRTPIPAAIAIFVHIVDHSFRGPPSASCPT